MHYPKLLAILLLQVSPIFASHGKRPLSSSSQDDLSSLFSSSQDNSVVYMSSSPDIASPDHSSDLDYGPTKKPPRSFEPLEFEELNNRLGLAGPYGIVQPIASKLNQIESDHIPPVAIWSYVDTSTLDQFPDRLKAAKEASSGNSDVKRAMGAISVPYEIHKKFPTTGQNGYDRRIQDLKNKGSVDAKIAMDDYNNMWLKKLEFEFEKNPRTLKVPTDLPRHVIHKDKTFFEYVWKENFDLMLEGAQKHTSNLLLDPTTTEFNKNMHELHLLSSKKFMASAIYYLKTPKENGLLNLIDLHIKEYQLYLGNSFEKYKLGFTKLALSHVDFGWIDIEGFQQLATKYRLPQSHQEMFDAANEKSPSWQNNANRIGELNEYSQNVFIRETTSNPTCENCKIKVPIGLVCPLTRRRKRSTTGNSCVFFSKNKPIDTDDRLPKKEPINEKLKPSLPSDENIASIDSRRVNKLLKKLDGGDITSVNMRESILNFVSRNSDKLTGIPEDIAQTKALVFVENLNAHAEQNALAKSTLKYDAKQKPKDFTKFQKVKVSATKFAKRANGLISKSEKVSGTYGKIMLAKGVVTAARHGDYTSLILMGGRIGLEYPLKAATKLGQKLVIKATTRMAKLGSQFLAKMAGPVGAIADIGISIYSLSESIKLLNDPNASKQQQNEAIADIVADSIDIAVTATAAVLSLVFPPLAPVFAAVAFIVNVITTLAVTVYKAYNHVESIDKQIPLLDYEKNVEFGRYVASMDTSDYIKDIIATKQANNIAVSVTVQFLIKNPIFIGRIFPSRTMYDPEAECALETKKCMNWAYFIPQCGDWSHASDCGGRGGYCKGEYETYKCESVQGPNFWVPGIGYTSSEYRCECGPEPETKWGYEIDDSEVDFSSKTQVFQQRSAPDFDVPSGFSYKCKPSSLYSEGDRVSNRFTSYGYLCKGAIGITKDYNNGKFMLYELGDGTDKITLDESESVDNHFVVNSGRKHFYGNAGDDVFRFVGPCNELTGTFDGKDYSLNGNTIQLESSCSTNRQIDVNLVSNEMDLGYGSVSSVRIKNIQRIFGRESKTEYVKADCRTKLIVGNGGSNVERPDIIIVPSCANNFELTVVAEGYTKLDASSFNNGKIYTLLKNKVVFQSIFPSSFSGTFILEFQSSVGGLKSGSFNHEGDSVVLGFDDGGSALIKFRGLSSNKPEYKCTLRKSQITTVLKTNNIDQQLVFNLDSKTVNCDIFLDRNVLGVVSGIRVLDNNFYLKSGNAACRGGQLYNKFILLSSDFSGSIAGKSNHNSLIISDNVTDIESLEINLYSEIVRGKKSFKISNIQNIYGQIGLSETVTTSCDTTSLHLGGAARDYVNIPSQSCEKSVAIHVKGKVTVVDRKTVGSTTIWAGYDNDNKCHNVSTKLPFDLAVSNYGGDLSILVNFYSRQILSASSNFIMVTGGNQISLNGKFPTILFEEELGYGGRTSIIKERGRVYAYNELKIEKEGLRNVHKTQQGCYVISNIFKLVDGTKWTVRGGNKDDTFSLVSKKFKGELNGFGGKNILFIDPDLTGNIVVNQAVLSFEDQSGVVLLKNINEVHGRAGKIEKITVTCDFLHVDMKGGNSNDFDEINIPKLGCNHKMIIMASGHTQLTSTTEFGNFDIYLQVDGLDDLIFRSEIVISGSTVFTFPIQYQAYKLRSYELKVDRQFFRGKLMKQVELKINLSGKSNHVHFVQKFDLDNYENQKQNVNIMFVDEEYRSNGNIEIREKTNEIIIQHDLQYESRIAKTRRGATGAKNVFRLGGGQWNAFGGVYDDTFLLNSSSFTGEIKGLGGVNTLILTDTLISTTVIVNLKDNHLETQAVVKISGIQIVGGRTMKQDKVICACDTKLVMLQGGESTNNPDIIEIHQSFCSPKISFVMNEFTTVKNLALAGNFTYHVRMSKNFDIVYQANQRVFHKFNFEIPVHEVTNVNLLASNLHIEFKDGNEKSFPIDFSNVPKFLIGEGPELLAELIIRNNSVLKTSIVATSDYAGSVTGINGAENKIVIKTSSSLQSIIGGNMNDVIFIDQLRSTKLIDGGRGTNRLQLSDKLYPERKMEINFMLSYIKFINGQYTSVEFAENIQKITLFTGRELSFDRVVLGCNTRDVRFSDEIMIQKDCLYNVRIELDVNTRVRFELLKADQNTKMEVNDNKLENSFLQPSIFYYHFSSVHSFDIEVNSFTNLLFTRHIFYLKLKLSDLSSIRFSLTDFRLIYSTHAQNEIEVSHVVGQLNDQAMFFDQPEFMTSEGFLLRITRYGEIVVVVGRPNHHLQRDSLQRKIIPRLAAYSSKLNISFMIETDSDFVYCGSPNEINLLTNRINVSSHLVGWNKTTYKILALDDDVYIYPQAGSENGLGTQVLDLTNIIFEIRNSTGLKYVPDVIQVGNNFEIEMANWTDTFIGKVTIVNGALYTDSIRILLNSIVMEILPTTKMEKRSKRSITDKNCYSWTIRPRPIYIPEGHSYIMAAEDLEDGVEIKNENENNVTFELSKEKNDLILTSISTEQIKNNTPATFIIYNYYASAQSTLSSDYDDNQTDLLFGMVDKFNGIQVNLGNEIITVSSNKPIISNKTGEEVFVMFYEDILDREEYEIIKDFPDICRKFEVSWQKKLARTPAYLYTFFIFILMCTLFVGCLIYIFCRKKTQKGKYVLKKRGIDYSTGQIQTELSNFNYDGFRTFELKVMQANEEDTDAF